MHRKYFLNVRKAPYSSSRIIGTIQRNEIVDVYDFQMDLLV